VEAHHISYSLINSIEQSIIGVYLRGRKHIDIGVYYLKSEAISPKIKNVKLQGRFLTSWSNNNGGSASWPSSLHF
jgi:hypothetical protein